MLAAALLAHPSPLWPDYRRFRVEERLLLSGHSHQAWPDVALRGHVSAFEDAALHVDDKWERAFAKAERVRRGYAKLLGDSGGSYALADSTHSLLVRFLSALPLAQRPKLVTTDGEFHSLRRQMQRLEEAGIEVVRVAAHPAATVGERLAKAVDSRTAAVIVSAVFFESAHVAGGLELALQGCEREGALLCVDAYHALNVVPFPLARLGLERAYVVGGGYKYMQLGEGNCFLRAPPDCRLRPVITGWFAEFGALAEHARPGQVGYGEGSARFAGSTYDPVSHYRAAEVLDFFEQRGLGAELLRDLSQAQLRLLVERFDRLDLDPRLVDRDRSVPLERCGGFLALRCASAGELHGLLERRGVLCDHRRDALRLGPAPYSSPRQLEQAIDALGEAARELRAG